MLYCMRCVVLPHARRVNAIKYNSGSRIDINNEMQKTEVSITLLLTQSIAAGWAFDAVSAGC